jgi:hypothetical protein
MYESFRGRDRLDAGLDVGVECPGGTEMITIEDLHVSLVQPAFGIDQEGTVDKAFVPGGLVFEATFDITGFAGPQMIRGGNEVAVLIEADPTGLSAPGVEVWGTAPCTGGGMGTVSGVFKLELDVGGSNSSPASDRAAARQPPPLPARSAYSAAAAAAAAGAAAPPRAAGPSMLGVTPISVSRWSASSTASMIHSM